MECNCPGRKAAMENGLKRFKKQKAPSCVVEDYILDMISGQWVDCTCNAGDE